MRIVPVIDLMGGVVVRGVAGRRDEYRPIQSTLTPSTAPLDIARAFRAHFRLTELYLADLDAIAGQTPALHIYRQLLDDGFTLLVDAGLHTADDATLLLDGGVAAVVAGLETLNGPQSLREMIDRFEAHRVVFSLDLKNGQTLTPSPDWPCDPWEVALRALDCGVRRMLVLDLSRVGVGGGTGTEALCRQLSTHAPDFDLLAGGGVRDQADLDHLSECGVKGALVASALHNGTLPT